MAARDASDTALADREHQAAYIFEPSDVADEPPRPTKRRRVSQKHAPADVTTAMAARRFQPLLGGAESDECVRLRQQLFHETWSRIDSRIHRVLRETNQSTLEEVTGFVRACSPQHGNARVPSAFIITGANVATPGLLFDQLADTLQDKADARVVTLRSADASNLKAALRKIIRHATARLVDVGAAAAADDDDDDDDNDVAVAHEGCRYLHYDLEALHSHLKASPRRHVVVAFQDSEAFDAGLLADLISLISSWLDRIPFRLLFGIATSVELFQARLSRSTCQLLYGEQFDVEQAEAIIGKIFRTAVIHADVPLRIGPSLLQNFLDRQRHHVAGIPAFVSALKYAHMCHFYTCPLSVLLAGPDGVGMLQAEHLESVRFLASFQQHVERALAAGHVSRATSLLEDDSQLLQAIDKELGRWRQRLLDVLRTLAILACLDGVTAVLPRLYIDALSLGLDMEGRDAPFMDLIRRLEPTEAISFIGRALGCIKHGDAALGLGPWPSESSGGLATLAELLDDISTLQTEAEENGSVLRSKYSGQSRVLRTTVIAQKVQLSRDAAALTDQDKQYTKRIDGLVECLKGMLGCAPTEDVWLNEAWLYDFRAPYRDVFNPRPRAAVQRALSRPHDYLGCTCCRSSRDQVSSKLPATAILFQLYQETGSLINVADLWSAYYATVSTAVVGIHGMLAIKVPQRRCIVIPQLAGRPETATSKNSDGHTKAVTEVLVAFDPVEFCRRRLPA